MKTLYKFSALVCLLLAGCSGNSIRQDQSEVLFMVGLQSDPKIVDQLEYIERLPGNKDAFFRFAFNPDSNASFQTIYERLQKKAYLENSRDMRYLSAMSYLAQKGRRNDIAAQAYIMAMFLANVEAARCVDPSSANRRVSLMQSQLKNIEAFVFAQPKNVRARNIELAIEHQQQTEKSPPAYFLCQGSMSDQMAAVQKVVDTGRNDTITKGTQPNEIVVDTSKVVPQLITTSALNAKIPGIIQNFRSYYLK